MAEPANSSAIVRAGADPITGSPLSAEARQSLFNRATISSASFRGNSNFIAPQRDNQQTIDAIQTNQQTLSGVQQQIISVRQEIGGLNAGLVRIATLLEEDSRIEQIQIRDQQERERQLAEQKIRLGKEDEFEKKIQSAVVAPVQKVAPKIENLFSNVGNAIGILFTGWLTNQVIEYLKAEEEKNTKKLLDIKNNILRNVSIAGGVLVSVRSGLSLFVNALRGVTNKIASLLGKIVAAPFKAGASLANAARNTLTGNKPGGAPPKPGGTPPKPGPVRGLLNTVGGGLRAIAGPAVTTAALATVDSATTGEDPGRAVAGAAGGVLASTVVGGAASLLPIPGSGFLAGLASYTPGEQIGKNLYDRIFGKKDQTTEQTQPPEAKIDSTAQPSALDQKPEDNKEASQPQTPLVPSADVSSNRPSYNLEEAKIQKPNGEDQKSKSEVVSPEPGTPSAEISPLPKQGEQKVSALPEPKPTVVMTPAAKQEQPTQPPITSGPLADVPLIPSSNPANYYVLYSQMHYNVVM